MKKIFLWLVITSVVLTIPIYLVLRHVVVPALSSSADTPQYNLADPISQFQERITKIPFGLYVSPENSPVNSKRFTGFHTAVDVEYEDVLDDVPVFAVNDGTVTLAREASGYGGVMILETNVDNQKHSVLYGHIRPASLPKVGQTFKKGDTIGLLGTGRSVQTDGERRHLHFAILTDTSSNLLGYVQTQAELSGWVNPLTFYPN